MSSKVVVDTCILSYIYKKDTRAKAYLRLLSGLEPLLSFMTVAELYRWPLESNWGEARTTSLKLFVSSYAMLPFNKDVCWIWAQIKEIKGRPMKDPDAWIAATAIAYQHPLVTHNVRDFEHINALKLIHEDGAI